MRGFSGGLGGFGTLVSPLDPFPTFWGVKPGWPWDVVTNGLWLADESFPDPEEELDALDARKRSFKMLKVIGAPGDSKWLPAAGAGDAAAIAL